MREGVALLPVIVALPKDSAMYSSNLTCSIAAITIAQEVHA